MAVPSSGEITMLGIAREKVYDNYSSSSAITAPISLKDLHLGGNTEGSGVSYEATNTTATHTGVGTVSTSAGTQVQTNQFRMNGSLTSEGTGAMNLVVPYRMSEFHGYDHDSTNDAVKGFVYSSSNSTPTIGGSGVIRRDVSGLNTGSYTYMQNTGVNQNTTYYIRAFISNAAGVAYGSVVSVSTPAGQTLYGVSMQYAAGHGGGSTVCDTSNTVTVYSTQSTAANILSNTPTLFSNSSGTSYASAGWYSDGNRKGRWGFSGTVVSGSVTDCADE
tara:strand:+ start:2492 stop:3316 length:825 start_codon:yes stop_codon:yes gene_type:complete